MNHQPVFQHIVQMPGNAHVVDVDWVGKCHGRNTGDDMPAAEPLALRDGFRFDVFSVRIQNQMGARAAHFCAIFQNQLFQLLCVFFNADIFGIRIHKFAGIFVQSFYPCFPNPSGNQIGKRNGISAGEQNTGITGEAAGSAENQAVGVFQQLPIHHDDVVGQSIDAVVQSLRTVLKQLLGGEGDKNRNAGGSQTPLNLNLV